MAIDQDRLIEIIAEQLQIDKAQIVPEASFMDDLGADSLDTVELVMALEEELNVEIPDDQAENIRTVQDAIDFLSSQQI